MSQTVLTSLTGYFGVAMVLFAYLQVSRNKWQGSSVWFQVVNALGSLSLLIYSLGLKAYANVALNSIWLLIAAVSLWRIRRADKS